MWAVAIVIGSFVVLGAVLKVGSEVRRSRLSAGIHEDDVVAAARRIPMRVLTEAGTVLPGMKPGRASRTTADLILTSDSLLVTSNRGRLLSIGPDRGRPLHSVRCTGPGRLVIEGSAALPGGSSRFRMEVTIADASKWAERLAAFVEPVEGVEFASWQSG